MFKVGDRVIRKKEFRKVNSWPHGDKILTVFKQSNENLLFEEGSILCWAENRFELVELITLEHLRLGKYAMHIENKEDWSSVQHMLFKMEIGWPSGYNLKKYEDCWTNTTHGSLIIDHGRLYFTLTSYSDYKPLEISQLKEIFIKWKHSYSIISSSSKTKENETNRDLQPIRTTEGSGAVRVQGKVCKTATGERFTGNKISLVKSREKVKSSIVTGKVLISRNY